MAGYDDRAPLSIEQDPAATGNNWTPTSPAEKVAWLGDLGGYLPMEPGVLDVVRASLRDIRPSSVCEVTDHPRLPTADLVRRQRRPVADCS